MEVGQEIPADVVQVVADEVLQVLRSLPDFQNGENRMGSQQPAQEEEVNRDDDDVGDDDWIGRDQDAVDQEDDGSGQAHEPQLQDRLHRQRGDNQGRSDVTDDLVESRRAHS